MADETVEKFADIVNKASLSLFNALKYCYLISDAEFYNISVKDIFRIGLNHLTDPECFKYLGLTLERDQIGEMAGEQFAQVLSIIRYSFAVRLPFARRDAAECNMKENLVRIMYDRLGEYGFANPDGIVSESFKSTSWLAKTKKPEPQFDTDWFRSWIYTYGQELAVINNRNMFLLGCADALFPLYYSSLKERLVDEFNKYGTS